MHRLTFSLIAAAIMLIALLIPASAQTEGYAPAEQPAAPIIIIGHVKIPNTPQGNFEGLDTWSFRATSSPAEEINTGEPTIDEIVHSEATK